MKSMFRYGTTLALAWFVCVFQFGALNAQTFYGSIVGTATDATGASVPGADVTLTNTATAERRTTQSNGDGNYEFVNLVPGHYRLDAQKTGFKHVTKDDIEVQVQATVRVDAGMQVGDVSQTVEVSAQAALLQTETSSLGTVVDQRKVQEMPLNGRNVLNLVTLVPGVVAQGNAMQTPRARISSPLATIKLVAASQGRMPRSWMARR